MGLYLVLVKTALRCSYSCNGVVVRVDLLALVSTSAGPTLSQMRECFSNVRARLVQCASFP